MYIYVYICTIRSQTAGIASGIYKVLVSIRVPLEVYFREKKKKRIIAR